MEMVQLIAATSPRCRHRRRLETASSRTGRGFTVLEFLFASAILLVVLISIVPLFPRAMASNLAGEESTQASVYGRSSLEENLQQDFNNWRLEIIAGSELVTNEYWSQGERTKFGDEEWLPGVAPSGGTDKWTRTLTVRQFQLTGVDDSDGDGVIDVVFGLEDLDEDGYFDNPMPTGTPRQAIHLKELDVQLTNLRNPGVLGVPSDLGLRLIKSF